MTKKEKVVEEDEPAVPDFLTVCRKTSIEVSARCAAVMISQPFHVIAIRSMAQFIGRETLYSTMKGSVIEIYSDD